MSNRSKRTVLCLLFLVVFAASPAQSGCEDCVVQPGEEGQTVCEEDGWENWENCQPVLRCWRFRDQESCMWGCSGSRCYYL